MKRVRAPEHALGHDHHREVALDQDGHHRRPADGNGDGGVQGQERQEAYEQGFGRHRSCSRISSVMAARACSSISRPLTGRTSMTIHLGSWRAGEICRRTK